MKSIRRFVFRNTARRRLRRRLSIPFGRSTLGIVAAAVAIALAGAGCGNLTLETPPDATPTIGAAEAITGGTTPARSEVPMNSTYRLVGYYASWDVYERAMFLTRIQTGRLTHINYAFSNISPDGQCILGDADADTQRFFGIGNSVSGTPDAIDGARGNFHQLALLKDNNPNLKVLISIGGWTWSNRFSDAALTDASRQKFVKSCIDLYLVQYRGTFDGVDIDWEYPVGGGLTPGRPEDKHNFTLNGRIPPADGRAGAKLRTDLPAQLAASASREAMGNLELGPEAAAAAEESRDPGRRSEEKSMKPRS